MARSDGFGKKWWQNFYKLEMPSPIKLHKHENPQKQIINRDYTDDEQKFRIF